MKKDMASQKEAADMTEALDSPDVQTSYPDEKDAANDASALELPSAAASRIMRVSSILTVLVSGVALFSDGYNAQIIGYMEPLFTDL